MMGPLHNAEGELTPLGTALRISALAVAIASGLMLIPASIFGLLSPMLCGGGCALAVELAVTVLVFSPLLLLISALSGAVAIGNLTWPLILMTLLPAMIVAMAWIAVSI
jgi:hypothetical protein